MRRTWIPLLVTQQDMRVDSALFLFSFRRIRLGWPSHVPEKDEAEDTSYPAANGSDDHPQDKSPSFSHFSRCDQASVFDYQPDETTHIRTIRVFEAIKVSESTGAFLRLTSGYGLPKEH